MAKLYFNYGAMNCGKSLTLLSKTYGFRERGIDVLILKSAIDTRDFGIIRSRALSAEERCLPIGKEDDLFVKISQAISGGTDYKWIFVDEAQFLSEKQVDELAKVVDILNINIICYGLRTDFRTKLFPGSQHLFEIADKVEEIKSTCNCGNRAIFNARIDEDGNLITEGEQVECGGNDRYITLCRRCFNREIAKIKSKQ